MNIQTETLNTSARMPFSRPFGRGASLSAAGTARANQRYIDSGIRLHRPWLTVATDGRWTRNFRKRLMGRTWTGNLEAELKETLVRRSFSSAVSQTVATLDAARGEIGLRRPVRTPSGAVRLSLNTAATSVEGSMPFEEDVAAVIRVARHRWKASTNELSECGRWPFGAATGRSSGVC